MWQLLEYLKDYRRSTAAGLILLLAATISLGWYYQRWVIAIPAGIIECLLLLCVIEE
jgi:hypothetical protein